MCTTIFTGLKTWRPGKQSNQVISVIRFRFALHSISEGNSVTPQSI